MLAAAGGIGRIWGREFVIRKPFPDESAAGTGLVHRPALAERPGDRRRRRGLAVRTGAAAARRPLSAASLARNHAGISRPHDPGVEALEVRYRLDGRGLPSRGHIADAEAVRVPDLRRRLQGYDRVGLSGAVAPRRAVHGLPADRVSGPPRRGLVAGAGSNHRAREQDQPGDGPPRAAFRHRRQRRKISALRISVGAGCAGCRRRICRPRSTICASDIRSTSRRCRARPRWTGTILPNLRPIRW